ncbi:unnamed protein product [Closterium sp. NIES-53]
MSGLIPLFLEGSVWRSVVEAGQVAASSQMSASGQLAASCLCRVLSHQTLLWHHCLGHPSLPRLRGMHSRLLVSSLLRSLPSLPRSPAPPCLLCVEGRQRATPHSSEFPPTTAPLQTLHMDADVSGVLIPWIRATGRQMRERFSRDFLVLRLHSDRGGEFSSNLIAEFFQDEGIIQSFTLPASPQQNGIAKRRIGLIMEVARASMIHVAAPHFMWSFAVQYAAHQLNLWPRVSEPEISPTLWWTGKVGDASVFRVWGALSLVRDAKANKLSSRTLRCVFLGFPTDAPPTTLAALGFAPFSVDPSLFLRTDTTLPPFYVLVYIDDLVFATADTEALALVKAELQERHTCTDLGELRGYLGLQITRDRARRTITLTQSHMVHQVLQRFGFQFFSPQPTPLSTDHSLSAPPSDESVEPSGPYSELVGCLITSGMGLLLGGQGSVRSTRSSSVLSSTCEAEIYAGAMAAQELRWLTYLLTDLGERPRSPPVLYVDNKAMLALCHEQRPEHRTKHIALCYFLACELQQRRQLRLSYVASRANTADVFTKALGSGDHQRFYTALGLVPTLPHLLVS